MTSQPTFRKANVRGTRSVIGWSFVKDIVDRWNSREAGVNEVIAIYGEIRPPQ